MIYLKPSFLKKIVLSRMRMMITGLLSGIGGDDDYWTLIENPTYDIFENILRISSMMCPARGVVILKLMKVVKKSSQSYI